jgi:A/G-specific adenine glycosylase
MSELAATLVAWQTVQGRNDLPWQNSSDPYKVWLSEIMLQQTQVSTVLGYYDRFLTRFPTVQALAAAKDEEVMSLWAGLGYYARARNLLACARRVVNDHSGRFPDTVEGLMALPGIGRSTAGAVLSLASDIAQPIMDGNVRRVFARYFGIHGFPGLPVIEKQFWSLAQAHLPDERTVRAYNQGLMDLGATLCTRSKPLCMHCPLSGQCEAFKLGTVSELPTPKPPVVRRQEHYRVVLRTSHKGVWLALRTGRGVWSGLWMAPMEKLTEAQEGQCLVHELTHRRYCLYPVHQSVVAESPEWPEGGRWFPLPLATDAPVPACLARLLALSGT